MAVSWLGSVAGTLAVTLMAILVATEVIARQVFNNPFLDTVLTGRLAMIFIIFLGVPWVMRQRRHVAVEFIVQRMPVRARAVVQSLGLTIALGAIGLAANETWEFAYFGLKLDEKLLGGFTAPAFPFQVTITIGFALLGLEVIRRIVIDLRQAFARQPKVVGAAQGEGDAPLEEGAWK